MYCKSRNFSSLDVFTKRTSMRNFQVYIKDTCIESDTCFKLLVCKAWPRFKICKVIDLAYFIFKIILKKNRGFFKCSKFFIIRIPEGKKNSLNQGEFKSSGSSKNFEQFGKSSSFIKSFISFRLVLSHAKALLERGKAIIR